MTKRIFRTMFLVVTAVCLAVGLTLTGILYSYFSKMQHDELRMQTNLAAQGVTQNGMEFFAGLDMQSYRFTWIDATGTVLYDNKSVSEDMENHMQREEIVEAIQTGYGESSRYSSTLMEKYLYAAKLLDDGSVLRVSVAQSSVWKLLWGMVKPLCLVLLVATALAFLLSMRLSKLITEPLNELDLDEPLSNEGYDELSPLLLRIDSQQKTLKQQETELQKKQDEFNAVTVNMGEGLILVNNAGVILSINLAAKKWLAADKDCIGKDLLTVNRSLEMQKLLGKALQGKSREVLLELSAGVYQLNASPVVSENRVSGAVILMFDVTEKSKAEQMRREFTANVSHELKTPLHSISGYAELLSNGMVRPEDVGQFSHKIYVEAQRMIRLVEDIMRLSHLDEGEEDLKRENFDLYQLAKDAMNSFAEEAEDLHVALHLTGQKTMVDGIPQFVSVMICNLCDNAIKYNRPDGSVTVDVKEEKGYPTLTVSDTGIGIPPEHQSRIFERFYRVDKSHSKDVGGTGLGLSIVKHAAKLHSAELKLQSTPGKGTTITIRFPKKPPIEA